MWLPRLYFLPSSLSVLKCIHGLVFFSMHILIFKRIRYTCVSRHSKLRIHCRLLPCVNARVTSQLSWKNVSLSCMTCICQERQHPSKLFGQNTSSKRWLFLHFFCYNTILIMTNLVTRNLLLEQFECVANLPTPPYVPSCYFEDQWCSEFLDKWSNRPLLAWAWLRNLMRRFLSLN